MTSKTQRRRKRKAANQQATTAPTADLRIVTAPISATTTQPTAERRARGTWHVTKIGLQDIACDLIGRLAVDGLLTGQQVEAARLFQEIHAAYVAELGTVGYRSCIAGGSGGYDAGDGNPEAIRAYNRMAATVGPKHLWILRQDCAKGPDDRSWSIEGLRSALDAMGA